MGTLVITNYCSTDKRKYRFKQDMVNDPLIAQYISRDFSKLLEDSENVKELKIGESYIIEEERKLVGFIKLHNITPYNMLDLHYAVHPDFRKNPNHYGRKILTEFENYAFRNINGIDGIELRIKLDNIFSKRCIRNIGFTYVKQEKGFEYYHRMKG